MFKKKPYTPEQPKEAFYTPLNWTGMKAEFDRLYLEKCKEVNRLEQEVEKYKSMVEIAVKQKGELRTQMDGQKALLEEQREKLYLQENAIKNLDEALAEAKQTIRELAAEPVKNFILNVEPPEELPEELMEELPLWALQPVTSQDILYLSSALKNLCDTHECESRLLYNKLAKVLEQKIKEYCGED